MRALAARLFRRPPSARKAAEERAVAEFRQAVSDYERNGRPGGCGCG